MHSYLILLTMAVVIIFASFLLSLEGVRARLQEVLLEVHLGEELDIRCPSEGDSVVVEGELVCSALLVLVAAQLLAVPVDLLVPAQDGHIGR
jgi:hypothetical protein